jgi:hypothetical protein
MKTYLVPIHRLLEAHHWPEAEIAEASRACSPRTYAKMQATIPP